MDFELITIPYGPLGSNMYLFTNSSGVFIVDPSVSIDLAEKFLGSKGISLADLRIKGILITHGHHDHIKCVSEWIKAYPSASVFFSSNDKELLGNPFMNCSYFEGCEITYDFKFSNLAGMYGMSIYNDSDLDIKVYETPGHTMGSVCYLFTAGEESVFFTGDTVFKGSVGRTDMPGGSAKILMESISRIKRFDPALKIYPGHGPASTIDEEVRLNPFFEM